MSDRRAWVPLGALTLLVVAALVVVGFLVARPPWFRDDVPSDREFAKTLLDIGKVNGIRLSDDNATSQSFTLPVPVDSRLERPVLNLRGTTQVAEASTVFLRVLVDGQSVYVDELPAGDNALQADIGLPDSVVKDGEVRVQVRTTGSLDPQRCNLNNELGALVVLDPNGTRVYGELADRLHTVRDLVANLDRNVTLVLDQTAEGPEWFATAARLAAFLTQQGRDVAYSQEADDDQSSQILLGTADGLDDRGWDSVGGQGSVQVGEQDETPVLGVVKPTADVVPTFLTASPVTTADGIGTDPTRVLLQQNQGRSITLAALGVDTSIQQLTDRRSWRVPYSLADLPGGALPSSLRLRMMVPPITGDARWLIEVRLNDELVDSRRLPGTGRQSFVAALPAQRQLVRNELVVTLIRERDLGGCNVRQTTYDVQLLPESSLEVGGTGTGFTAVPAQFSGGFDVILPASALADPTLNLARLVPTLAEFSGWRQNAAFVWDGAPSGRPFLLVGEPPAGVSVPVKVAGGRISAPGFDLTAFKQGIVAQCATAGRARGLVLTVIGDPGDIVPAYGREPARLVGTRGGGFVVSPTGRVVSEPNVRAESGG